MATLRLFAQAREIAGDAQIPLEAATVGDVLDAASERFGPEFGALLATCQVWRNGQPTTRDEAVEANDEVAVLPPVSGG